MRAKVAVATVDGKAYFLIVNELMRRNILFFSLVPGKPVPVWIKLVITTEKERGLVDHDSVIVFDPLVELECFGNTVVKLLQGKVGYEKVVVGVDPGEVFGLVVLGDALAIYRENCFSVKEVMDKIISALKNVGVSSSTVTVRIGNGVPVYLELLRELDRVLPVEVTLEIVGESGTNRNIGFGRRRGLRDIVSAIRIAGRHGRVFVRRKEGEM
jgi:hypothetical protein